eukprot:ANDGO_01001.mRNA.1 Inosine triphosphate pyrophosphatase
MTCRIIFVTGNANKVREVRAILGASAFAKSEHSSLPFSIENVSIDLPELQGPDAEWIAKEKARTAGNILRENPSFSNMLASASAHTSTFVLVEDTSLCFTAMKGLPGPYIKWFLDSLGLDGLPRMLDGFSSRDAWAQCTLAIARVDGDSEAEVRTFVGVTHGSVVMQPRVGSSGKVFGWDPIFEPSVSEGGSGLTYSEMPAEQKNTISHRYKALASLSQWIHETFQPSS